MHVLFYIYFSNSILLFYKHTQLIINQHMPFVQLGYLFMFRKIYIDLYK